MYEVLSVGVYALKETIEKELAAKGTVKFYTTLRLKMRNDRFTTESLIT